MRADGRGQRRPVLWEGSSKRNLKSFPGPVQKDIGVALFVVQLGGTPPTARPWHGLGPGVFELAEDYRGDAYRCVYTVTFPEAVYVLHAFRKKSKTGIRTPELEVKLIEKRWKALKTRRAGGAL